MPTSVVTTQIAENFSGRNTHYSCRALSTGWTSGSQPQVQITNQGHRASQ